jgi:hypothetical protein
MSICASAFWSFSDLVGNHRPQLFELHAVVVICPRCCSDRARFCCWGYWKWGENFGWEWGFATEPRAAPEAPALTFVLGRTASLNGDTVYEQTLAVWNHAQLAKFFTRRQVRTRREGRHVGEIPRLPGAARLIDQGRVLNVPARCRVSARDDPDWLDIEYSVEAALQISVPMDFGFGLVELNETFGMARVHGEIGGRPVGFIARACFEFMG